MIYLGQLPLLVLFQHFTPSYMLEVTKTGFY